MKVWVAEWGVLIIKVTESAQEHVFTIEVDILFALSMTAHSLKKSYSNFSFSTHVHWGNRPLLFSMKEAKDHGDSNWWLLIL